MQITDTILVSFTFDSKSVSGSAVLCVGKKKKGQAVDIINAFQGEEAIDIYKKLLGNKRGLDE